MSDVEGDDAPAAAAAAAAAPVAAAPGGVMDVMTALQASGPRLLLANVLWLIMISGVSFLSSFRSYLFPFFPPIVLDTVDF